MRNGGAKPPSRPPKSSKKTTSCKPTTEIPGEFGVYRRKGRYFITPQQERGGGEPVWGIIILWKEKCFITLMVSKVK